MKNIMLNKVQYFHELCSNEKNILLIRKIISLYKNNNFFNILPIKSLLLSGLFNSIINNQDKLSQFLIKIIINKKIVLDFSEIEALFNILTENNNVKLLKMIENNFNIHNIINKSAQKEGFLNITEKGEVYNYIFIPEEFDDQNPSNNYIQNSNNKFSEYYRNCFEFSNENNNKLAIEYMLEMLDNINPSLVEQIFVDSVIKDKNEMVECFLMNNKTFNIIIKSDKIKLFLNENTETVAMKKEIKDTISKIIFRNKLNISMVTKEEKTKKTKI